MSRVQHLDTLERLPLEGRLQFLPVREALGVTSVAIAAFRAEAVGDIVVEPHDEVASPNAGRHEEWYRAQGAVAAADFERAIALTEPGLADHPHNGSLHYQLACYTR